MSRHRKLLRPGTIRGSTAIKEENIDAWLNPDRNPAQKAAISSRRVLSTVGES
jgi:hypothetical protein